MQWQQLLLLLVVLSLLSTATCGLLRLLPQPPMFAYWCLIYLLLIENLSFRNELDASEIAHGKTKELLKVAVAAVVMPPPVVFKRRALSKIQ